MLPALMFPASQIENFGFVNAFLNDKGHDVKYKNSIYLLFEPEAFDVHFKKFVETQYKHPLFLEDYDVGYKQVVIVYRFPEKYLQEYRYFIKGRYSKFSKKYIEAFFPMTSKQYKDGQFKQVATVFSGIFKKEEWLKKYWEEKLGLDPDLKLLPEEYWSVPDADQETLRVDNLTILNKN